jgi:GDP-fucose protein O-fucosyltransferase
MMKSTHLLLVSASAIAIVALCSSMMSIYHLKQASPPSSSSDFLSSSVIHSVLRDFARTNKATSSTARTTAKEMTPPIKVPTISQQRPATRSAYAALDCSKHDGGPALTLDDTAEMVYWKDRSDASYDPAPPSTYTSGGYLTFEPDGGGWNNIRMAMETIVALAIAMNRTLVLPPEQRMYLLGNDRGKQKTDFSFRDFFPMNNLQELRVITMQEFLEQHAMLGKMEYRAVTSGQSGVAFPPENRTDWNGQDVKMLKEWLRNTTETPRWSPSQCLAVFPVDHDHIPDLQAMHQDILQNDLLTTSKIPPPDLSNATTRSRLREHLAKRRELCVYDNAHEPVLHFMCSHKDQVRMLVHFYAFVFFEDMAADLWLKRFVRDHLRYVDEIQCAAARIVASLRHESPDGIFDTLQYVDDVFYRALFSLSHNSSLTASVEETFNTKTLVLKRAKSSKTFKMSFPAIQQYTLRPTNAKRHFSIHSRSITMSNSSMITRTNY